MAINQMFIRFVAYFVLAVSVQIHAQAQVHERILSDKWLLAMRNAPDVPIDMIDGWTKLRGNRLYMTAMQNVVNSFLDTEASCIHIEMIQAGSIGRQHSIYFLDLRKKQATRWYPYEHATGDLAMLEIKKIQSSDIASLKTVVSRLPTFSVDMTTRRTTLDGMIFVRAVMISRGEISERIVGGWSATSSGTEAGRIAEILSKWERGTIAERRKKSKQ